MRVPSVALVVALAGLLCAGTATAAAETDETGDAGPSMFTWVAAGPPRFADDPTTGQPVVVVEIEASDPRAAGTATAVEEVGRVEAGDWGYFVLRSAMRLVNEGGAWLGTGRGVSASEIAGEGEAFGGAWVNEYVGVDGYEGMIMYTFMLNDGDTPRSIGFIVPADVMPPDPDLPSE